MSEFLYAPCEENGYFTLEATLIAPIVLGVLLSIFYMGMACYNTCLARQNAAIISLWGSYSCFNDEIDAEELMREQGGNHQRRGYFFFHCGEEKYTAIGRKRRVQITGWIPVVTGTNKIMEEIGTGIPVRGISQNEVFHQTEFIRGCRRIGELKNNGL